MENDPKNSRRALLYGWLWRGTQLFAGPITLLFIANFLSAEVQGFFYTFASLLALQSFFELGFYIVVTNAAAHEWAKLSLGADRKIEGDPSAKSRLLSLGRLVARWYGVAGIIFFCALLTTGFALFSAFDTTAVTWRAPWIALCLIAALNFFGAPFVALLEGCGQVAEVHRFSFFQAMLSGVSGIVALALGLELWAAVVIAGGQLVGVSSLLLIRYRSFMMEFFQPPSGAKILWAAELWPMQWRLGLSGVVYYFSYTFFVPVMFYYHGASVAGQMGMTLQIVSGIQTVALIWLKIQIPNFGVMVARKDFIRLDLLWLTTAKRTLGTFLAISALALGAFIVLGKYQIELADRVLPLELLGVFLAAGAFVNLIQSFAAYLRAHLTEPLLTMSVTCSLAVGMLTWLLGSKFGPAGVAWGYLGVMIIGATWACSTYQYSKARWQKNRSIPAKV